MKEKPEKGSCRNCSSDDHMVSGCDIKPDYEIIERYTDYKGFNLPSHYDIEGLGKDTVDVINAIVRHNTEDVVMGAYLFNALKYLFRFGKKNGKEDLFKAKDFIERMIEELE